MVEDNVQSVSNEYRQCLSLGGLGPNANWLSFASWCL